MTIYALPDCPSCGLNGYDCEGAREAGDDPCCRHCAEHGHDDAPEEQ